MTDRDLRTTSAHFPNQERGNHGNTARQINAIVKRHAKTMFKRTRNLAAHR